MWVVVLVIVGALLVAAASDLNDRRKGRKVRSSGQMVDIRRERRMNLRSTPMHGVPPARDFAKRLDDDLKDPNRGGV